MIKGLLSDGVRQDNNSTGGGDLAGRDIVKPVTYISNTYNQPRKGFMARYSERYRQDLEQAKTYQGTVDRLRHYTELVIGETIIGLEDKLSAAHFPNIEWAKTAKENFVKQLAMYQFSESAQMIHAHLLAALHSRFENFITPLIVAGQPIGEILAVVHSKLIEYIEEKAEDNVTELDEVHFNGMLYFLTGNCHIKWTP